MAAATGDITVDRQAAPLGFHHDPQTITTSLESRELDLYVKGEQGPPLILLHELPGLSHQTFALGDFFWKRGFRVVLPLLFGKAGKANMLGAGLQICLQKELREICLGRDGAMTRVIRKLAQQELIRYREQVKEAPGVAVVGMCFTGSMALALLLREEGQGHSPSPVAAPVMAQPSSGYSARALEAVRNGEIRGPVLALRFEKDWICTARKLGRLEAAFATCPAQESGLIVHELEGCGHSTLVYQYKEGDQRRDLRSPDRQRIDAREAVTSFLLRQLKLAPRSTAD
jgi:dienelactone hydrolase